MLPYIAMYAVCGSLLLLAKRLVKNQANWILFLVLAILWLFAGMRGAVGSDTPSYLNLYSILSTPESIFFSMLAKEPGFVALLALHKAIFDSEILYIIMMSFLQASLLYAVVRSSSNRYIFLLCYVLLFYLNFHFNITRAALATMLFLYGLSGNSIVARRAALVFAPLFHLSILPFYLFFLKDISIKRIALLFLAIIILIAGSASWLVSFWEKFLSYKDYGGSLGLGISISALVFVFSAIGSLIVLRGASYAFRFAVIFLILSHFLSFFYGIGYRYVITASLFYYYYLIEELTRSGRLVLWGFLWVPVILGFLMVLSGINNETKNLELKMTSGDLVSEALDSTYIPYRFFWDDSRFSNR